jgi:hypothetical protein
MASKISQLLTLGGLALVGISNCVYLVDPGEKALIMNNLTGLKKEVFHQGYHLRIPFVEVARTNQGPHHLRRPPQAYRHSRDHRNQGFADRHYFTQNTPATHR